MRTLGVDELSARAPWLVADVAALRERDHDLDALVCALVGRAAATGRTAGPRADQLEVAGREGWIHLPTGDLAGLAPDAVTPRALPH